MQDKGEGGWMSIHDNGPSMYGLYAVDDDEKEREWAATRPKFF
jgi:hypothetical protein